MLLLLRLHNVLLLQTLERKCPLLIAGQMDELDTAKAAHAEGGNHLQIVEGDVFKLFGDLQRKKE